jgi:TolB-like protein/AraC-like DNA-binding protein/Tfp pilus assembly protein PilF
MTDASSIDQVFIRKLTDIVLANLGNANFGVKGLVHESGISLYRLNRRLHSINSKTTRQFIQEIRLQKALEMLQNEECNVSEIAYKAGFSSPSYFNSCFHEFFGYPPGKVKKRRPEPREENIFVPVNVEQKTKTSSLQTFLFISGGILALTGLIYLVYSFLAGNNSGYEGNSVINPEKSIAVLPFRNLSEDITDQYVYDGIMEEIFNSLTKIHQLRVISHTSAEKYRNTTKNISEIGRELDVNYVVEGSGQKFGSTFRLRVQLIEVSTDSHIWAKSYQQRMKDTRRFFRTQSRIAKNIASELRATITPDEKEMIEKVPTANMAVLNLYLKANSYQKDIENIRNDSSYQTAVDLYNAAIGLDSTFAKAYTGLAFAYWNRYYYETYFEEDYLGSCLALAEKAIKYDDHLDEAYFIKGEYFRITGQPEEALENYDKALEFNPNYYLAYLEKGHLFASLSGDYVKALESYHKGLILVQGEGRKRLLSDLAYDYLCVGFIEKAKYYYHEAFVLSGNKSAYLNNLSWIEFCQGNFEQALTFKEQQLEIDSTTTSLLNYSVIPGHNRERYASAESYVEKSKKSGVLTLQSSHRIGFAFWQAGKKNDADYYFNQQIRYSEESIKLNRITAQRKVAQYDLAGTYAFLGNKAKAYRYLEDANKKNVYPLWWITLIKNDPMFSNIRNEERFQKIEQNMESKYNAEHERVRIWLTGQGSL